MPTSVLIVTTSHDRLGLTGEPTGLWFEELATPYYLFKDAGLRVTLASVAGGVVPIDPRSRGEAGTHPASVARFLADETAMNALESTSAVTAYVDVQHDAIFLPGGHGTMWDYPQSEALALLISQTLQRDKIVGAVCHGPAGLVAALDREGSSVVKGRRVSAFTNEEEAAVGLTDKVPFLLETRLTALGGRFEKGPAFAPFAVSDRGLVTGQNPASSEKVADLMLKELL